MTKINSLSKFLLKFGFKKYENMSDCLNIKTLQYLKKFKFWPKGDYLNERRLQGDRYFWKCCNNIQ
jgi:hypothetical protein